MASPSASTQPSEFERRPSRQVQAPPLTSSSASTRAAAPPSPPPAVPSTQRPSAAQVWPLGQLASAPQAVQLPFTQTRPSHSAELVQSWPPVATHSPSTQDSPAPQSASSLQAG